MYSLLWAERLNKGSQLMTTRNTLYLTTINNFHEQINRLRAYILCCWSAWLNTCFTNESLLIHPGWWKHRFTKWKQKQTNGNVGKNNSMELTMRRVIKLQKKTTVILVTTKLTEKGPLQSVVIARSRSVGEWKTSSKRFRIQHRGAHRIPASRGIRPIVCLEVSEEWGRISPGRKVGQRVVIVRF